MGTVPGESAGTYECRANQYSEEGKNGEQVHYNSKGQWIGTSHVAKDGSTHYYNKEGERIYRRTYK